MKRAGEAGIGDKSEEREQGLSYLTSYSLSLAQLSRCHKLLKTLKNSVKLNPTYLITFNPLFLIKLYFCPLKSSLNSMIYYLMEEGFADVYA